MSPRTPNYKGSTIEVIYGGPVFNGWCVTFEIPATTIQRNAKALGWMSKSGFKTQDDALKWAKAEIDGFLEST